MLLKFKRIGVIGVGNMGQSIIRGLIEEGKIPAENIYATNRSEGKLNKLVEKYDIQKLTNNEDLVEKCDAVVLAVKPQDVSDTIEPLYSIFDSSKVVISLAAGVPIASLKKMIGNNVKVVRLMPNTPISVRKGVLGFCLSEEDSWLEDKIIDLFSPLGLMVPVEEGDIFEALTVTSGSGPGFIYELMGIWQDWLVEHGFPTDVARAMTTQTFLGTATLASENAQTSLDDLQKKVTSKKGVTHAGLQSMRELGIDRVLRISFEKAALRDRELAKLT